MPIYEYRCKACGTVIEAIQRFGDRPLRKCKECSGRLEKLISSSAFHLKGGGWYAQGYSKGGSGKSASATSSTGDGSEKKTPKKASPCSFSKEARNRLRIDESDVLVALNNQPHDEVREKISIRKEANSRF